MGIPMRLARKRMMPDPTIEFAIPPPVSPTGAGTWVKKARFSELAPL